MTRPSHPRLPELAGMTEAGFNRVVAMIQPLDFYTPHACTRPWGWSFPLGCAKCRGTLDNYNEWRASLPKVRNKKQRKAANVPRWTEEDIRTARAKAAEWDELFASFESTEAARLSAWTPWTSPLVDGATPRAESWGPGEAAPCRVSAVPCSACGWAYFGMGAVVGTEHTCRCGGGTYVIGDHWLIEEAGG